MKKLVAVLFLMIFVSCFVKIDSIESNKGELKISIEWPEEVEVNPEVTSQLHVDTHKIQVKLIHKTTGKTYIGETIKDPEKTVQEVVVDSVLDGSYNMEIRSFDTSNNLLAIIYDTLDVSGGGTNEVSAKFGAPNAFETNPVKPTNGSTVTEPVELSWKSISSNFQSQDETLDNMTYNLYLSTSETLDTSSKLDISKTSLTENLTLTITETELFAINFIFNLNQKYYWKLTATNTQGTVTSNTWNFVYNNNIGKLSAFDGTETYDNFVEGQRIEFNAVSVANNGGDTSYDTITYSLQESSTDDFATYTVISTTPTLVQSVYDYQFDFDIYSEPRYFRVEAKNSISKVYSKVEQQRTSELAR